jgi:hypothetical protein
MATNTHESEAVGSGDNFVTFITGHHAEPIVEHLLKSPIIKYMETEGVMNAGTHAFVTINIIQHDVLMLEVMLKTKSALPESIIFHSLDLWQKGSDEYVSNMHDGQVPGFSLQRKPISVYTYEDFVCYILQNLFQDAVHPYDVKDVCKLCSWCRDPILNGGVKSTKTGDAEFCTDSCLQEAVNQNEPDRDAPELLFSHFGDLRVFSSDGYEGDIEVDELLEFAFRLKSADETGIAITLPEGGGRTRQVGYVDWWIDSPRDEIRPSNGDLPEALYIHLENGSVLKADLHDVVRGLSLRLSEVAKSEHVLLKEA